MLAFNSLLEYANKNHNKTRLKQIFQEEYL